ncbi:Rv3235 family protein [Microbacterium sp. ZW T5_56]|uniref:Rv3235 family protein n=1 Tax=Microbacterium sp. ZW T5_56 TaxID=3378081 RepID=UPI0038545151
MARGTGAVRALQRASTVEITEFFAPQRTSTVDLPDPAVLLRNLTVGVLESLAGVRDVDQLARWLSQEAFLSVVTRVGLATRARSARGVAAARPHQQILCVRHTSPADGVVEGVVVVATPTRTRAIAIRLEGFDRRWRAVSIALL